MATAQMISVNSIISNAAALVSEWQQEPDLIESQAPVLVDVLWSIGLSRGDLISIVGQDQVDRIIGDKEEVINA